METKEFDEEIWMLNSSREDAMVIFEEVVDSLSITYVLEQIGIDSIIDEAINIMKKDGMEVRTIQSPYTIWVGLDYMSDILSRESGEEYANISTQVDFFAQSYWIAWKSVDYTNTCYTDFQ